MGLIGNQNAKRCDKMGLSGTGWDKIERLLHAGQRYGCEKSNRGKTQERQGFRGLLALR